MRPAGTARAVLRSEASNTREFNSQAYAVFGPKLVATRRVFEDRALESRCLTEEMGHSRLGDDVSISLPPGHKEEALRAHPERAPPLPVPESPQTAARRGSRRPHDRAAVQIFVPVMTMVENPEARAELRELARRYNGEMIEERGIDMEAQILEVIRDMLTFEPAARLGVKGITDRFTDRLGADYEQKITIRWIGSVIHRRLNLRTQKSHGIFVIPVSESWKLPRLYEKYGMELGASAADIEMMGAEPLRR